MNIRAPPTAAIGSSRRLPLTVDDPDLQRPSALLSPWAEAES